MTLSPAILSSVIQHHLEQHKPSEPEAVTMLQDSFYVDDLVGGAMDNTQALRIHEKASNIMNAGGFKLRKWNSNSRILREKVANDTDQVKENEKLSSAVEPLGNTQEEVVIDNMTGKEIRTEPDLISVDDNINSQWFEPEVDSTQTSSVKILRLNWNVETDEIQYDLSAMVNYASALPPTKRSVL